MKRMAMIHFLVNVLFIFLALAFSSGSNALVISDHPILGQVTIADQDVRSFRVFESHLSRASVFAAAMGVRRLPIQTTQYLGVNETPGYDVRVQHLSVGGLPPRQQGGENFFFAVSVHEFAHAIFYQYAADRLGISIQQLASGYGADFTAIKGFQEFFADSFAALLLNDPVGIVQENRAFLTYIAALNETRQQELLRGQPLQSFVSSLLRRGFTGNAFNQCSLTRADETLWFDTARRTLWNEIFIGKFQRRQMAIPVIMRTVMDMGVQFLREVIRSRQIHERFMSRLTPGDRRRLANERRRGFLTAEPFLTSEFPEDYFDFRMRDQLRTQLLRN